MAIVLQKPDFPPHVCIRCGVGDDRRKWYVNIDISLDLYFNPVMEGVVYFCNECWESLAQDVVKQAQILLFGLEPFNKDEYVEPTYSNESELIDDGFVEGRLVNPADAGTDPEPSEHSPESEPGDSGVEGNTSANESSGDADESEPVGIRFSINRT